jgi:hypothetical protein
MNKLYIIVPLVFTVLFGGVYYSHTVQASAAAAEAALVAQKTAEVETAKKADAERQAREDADKRAAERIAEEKRKELEKAAKWAAQSQEIAADTATYLAQAAKNLGETKALETKLAALRAEKDKLSQSVFDFDKEVETARIAKRNAELEIQRLVEMVARKGGTTLGTVTATP